MIKFWRGYHFLTTKTSLTLRRSRWISRHIPIISYISYTIIVRFFIPYCCFKIYIIKIFSINCPKTIPKFLRISLFHPIWSLYTILTISRIQKSSDFITWYRIFIWKYSYIQTNLWQPLSKCFCIHISHTSQTYQRKQKQSHIEFSFNSTKHNFSHTNKKSCENLTAYL